MDSDEDDPDDLRGNVSYSKYCMIWRQIRYPQEDGSSACSSSMLDELYDSDNEDKAAVMAAHADCKHKHSHDHVKVHSGKEYPTQD